MHTFRNSKPVNNLLALSRYRTLYAANQQRFTSFLQCTRHVRELSLLQLRLPEDRIRIIESMLDPSILLDMVQVDETSRVRITMRRGQNTSPAELKRLFLRQIILVLRIEHAVRERLSGTHAEKVAGETGAVGIDVVECWTFGGRDAGAHGAHGQTHAFVAINEVGEDLGSGGDGDAALVAEFVETALHA